VTLESRRHWSGGAVYEVGNFGGAYKPIRAAGTPRRTPGQGGCIGLAHTTFFFFFMYFFFYFFLYFLFLFFIFCYFFTFKK
jgi:hypothetical protein